MFLKLFKHAFFRPMKSIITLMIISLGMSLIAGISYSVVNSLTKEPRTLFFINSLLAFMPSAINMLNSVSVILVYVSFSKAVSKDEAYFTFTMPATPAQQLGARFLAILCWIVASSIVTAISLGIMFTFGGDPFGIGGVFKEIFTPNTGSTPQVGLVGFNDVVIVIEIIILWIICELGIVIHVMFLILLNSVLSAKLRSKASIVIVAFIVFAEVVVLFSIIMIVILFGVLEMSGYGTVHAIMWFFIVLFGAIGAISWYFSYRFMRRVNLA